jgi:hypothetical protein
MALRSLIDNNLTQPVWIDDSSGKTEFMRVFCIDIFRHLS